MLRSIGRMALRSWGLLGVAPGYLYQAIERWGPRTAGDGPLRAELPNGCRIDCDLSDHVMRLTYYLGCYEPVESYLFTRLLRPGMVVIDAGANVGQYTLFAAPIVGDRGSVHSFEPVPGNFARLERHVQDNGLRNVHLNRMALWHENGPLTLGLPAGAQGNHGAYAVSSGPDKGSGVESPGIRLDSYSAEEGLARLDLIKMDVEGAEPFVVAGGRGTLERFHPTIFMEVCRQTLSRKGSSPAALWGLLSSLGYRAWRIAESAQKSGPVADLEGIAQGNVILHREDLPESVRYGWDLRGILNWARSAWFFGFKRRSMPWQPR